MCQSFFFNKVAGLSPESCNFIKKETLTKVFPANFAKLLKTPFLQNPSGRLLLQPLRGMGLQEKEGEN